MSEESKEEYLEAIYGLIEEGEEATPGEIAKKLRVKPSSVTEMLKRLDSEGFVVYTPYKSVKLTEKGYRKASSLKRKHRLLERFLHDVLNIKSSRVHDEACRMEHSLSDEVGESISRLLNNPSTCPDDEKKIPSAEAVTEAPSLLNLKEGEKAVVAYLAGGKGFNDRVRSIGIVEGKTIEVVVKEPFCGPIVLRLGETTISIGRGMASKIKVIPR